MAVKSSRNKMKNYHNTKPVGSQSMQTGKNKKKKCIDDMNDAITRPDIYTYIVLSVTWSFNPIVTIICH